MTDDLVTDLLPILGRSLDRGFNVFDVMHHGTHEKQISNVFGWLLDVGGNHDLHDRFLQIFIDEVNAVSSAPPLPHETYWVRQEVNTGVGPDQVDIADLILEGPSAVLVVENYFTSDGHGHSYERYREFSHRNGKQGAVVLLCRDEDRSRQSQGWENAVVLTYSRLIHLLSAAVDGDARYQRKNPDAHAFIRQLQQKFVRERGLVGEQDVLKFVTAVCETGEAGRYGESPHDKAAEQFASDLAAQARERFDEGREVLRQLKGLLRHFAAGPLRDQLNASLGHERVHKVSANFAGIYQWTINLDVLNDERDATAATIQLKFGPSAWIANEQDPHWKVTVDGHVVDYSKVFVTHSQAGVIRQSTVTLQDVLDGLDSADTRLHDEVIQLLDVDATA